MLVIQLDGLGMFLQLQILLNTKLNKFLIQLAQQHLVFQVELQPQTVIFNSFLATIFTHDVKKYAIYFKACILISLIHQGHIIIGLVMLT